MKSKQIYNILDKSIESYKELYAITKNEMFLNKWEAMVTLKLQLDDFSEEGEQ